MADIKTELTAKIVAAYLGNNTAEVSDIPGLIQSTYATLVGTETPVSATIERQSPCVPIKKSVTASHLVCLNCGKKQKMLKRHITTAHGMSVDEYRDKWGLPADYPMVAAEYAARRSVLAKAIGLGNLPKKKASPKPAPDVTKTEAKKPRRKSPAAG